MQCQYQVKFCSRYLIMSSLRFLEMSSIRMSRRGHDAKGVFDIEPERIGSIGRDEDVGREAKEQPDVSRCVFRNQHQIVTDFT